MGPAKHLRCVGKVRSHLKSCKCWPCHAFEVFEVRGGALLLALPRIWCALRCAAAGPATHLRCVEVRCYGPCEAFGLR